MQKGSIQLRLSRESVQKWLASGRHCPRAHAPPCSATSSHRNKDMTAHCTHHCTLLSSLTPPHHLCQEQKSVPQSLSTLFIPSSLRCLPPCRPPCGSTRTPHTSHLTPRLCSWPVLAFARPSSSFLAPPLPSFLPAALHLLLCTPPPRLLLATRSTLSLSLPAQQLLYSPS